jgi:pyridoxal phosphate enzyme (YggS family)
MREELQSIRDRIARAAESVGRDPSEVTLVAVSKSFGPDAIQEAYDLGLRDFGESRFQEAFPKIKVLPADIRWHFIGSIQSNKARRIAEAFHLIQSLSSETAAREIDKAEGPTNVLIEVNIAQEPQKSGISLNRLDEFAQSLLHYPQVHLLGLMTVGPALEPEEMRPYFREMRRLRDRLRLSELSMGMSSDFDVAIQEGATHIRVGRALFGARR